MPIMPRKTKAAPVPPTIPQALFDQFVNGPMSAEAVNADSMAFKKALIGRALGSELTHQLGYASGAARPSEGKNQRNGASGRRS
jgi:putative transposase